ncbi:unnamed protein product, partial [Mesorhabditis belari]|uniref:Uncharacterized protein n=1 Tax=Mesorhabditis belari TaxID=2138241 RepID=A0AAF3J6L6_9BILA
MDKDSQKQGSELQSSISCTVVYERAYLVRNRNRLFLHQAVQKASVWNHDRRNSSLCLGLGQRSSALSSGPTVTC